MRIHRTKNRIFLSLIVLLLLSLSPRQGLAKNGDMRFAVIHLVPYGFFDSQENATGYHWDLAKALMDRVNIPYNMSLMPLPRLAHEIQNNGVDCTFYARTHVTEGFGEMVADTGLFLRGGVVSARGNQLNNYEDLQALKIGVPAGVKFYKKFDFDSSLNKIRVPNYASGIEMLYRERVDALIGNIDSFYYYLETKNMDLRLAPPLEFARKPLWLVCGHHYATPERSAALHYAMTELQANGQIRAILDRFGLNARPGQ